MGSFCSSPYIIRQEYVTIQDSFLDAENLEKKYVIEACNNNTETPNFLIGYDYNISFKIQNYVKYENGLYLYSSPMMNAYLLFGLDCTFDIINNFRVNNPDVQMLIEIEKQMQDHRVISNLYEAENFELKYKYAFKYNRIITFKFISKSPISEAFSISTTKYLAGPKVFRKYVQGLSDVASIYITDGPVKKGPKEADLWRTIFDKEIKVRLSLVRKLEDRH
jgi:hypothetical protein